MMKKKGLLSLCAMVMAFVLAFPVCASFAENNAYVKYTNSGKINLRSGAASNTRVLAAISPGTPLEVLDVYGKWAHVFVANPEGYGTLEGYMYTDYIQYTSYQPVSNNVVDTTNYYQNSAPTITENTVMYVSTGNSGRLNLREYASQNARSLGLYDNGTQVTVLNRSGGWAYVYVNGTLGYMMLSCLSTNPYNPAPQPISGAVTKYVSTGNSGKLHLRESASQNSRSLGLFPNGTKVSAVDLNNGWSLVNVNGLVGYMMSIYLSLSQPYVSPAPYNPSQYKLMYVCIANGHVSLRSEMSDSGSVLGNYANGTQVYVVYDFGAWSYVYVNGQNGYMKNSVLAKSPYVSPGTPIGTATVTHPNGSFVYLRSSRSTASLDNVLAKVPSGAKVTLYQKDEWYSLVQYNGITGYMVSHYLNNGSSSSPSSSSSSGSVSLGGKAQAIYSTYMCKRAEKSTAIDNVVTALPAGATVDIIGWAAGDGESWYKVRYNGLTGFVLTSLLSLSSSAGSPQSTTPPAVPSVPAGAVTGIGVVWHPNGSFVNLRYSRSTEDSSNILAQVPYGSKVEVMEQSGNWTKVRYNGVVGYMVSDYVYVDKAVSASPASTGVPLSVPSFPLTPATPTLSSPSQPEASIPSFPLTPATPNLSSPSQPEASVPVSPVTPATSANTFNSGSSSKTKGNSYSVKSAAPSQKKREWVIHNEESTYVLLRSTPDSSSRSNILLRLENGTVVQMMEHGETWSKVEVNELQGYVLSKCIKLQ